MEKKGVDALLNSKEAKVSILLLISIIAVFVLTLSMSTIFVSGLTVNITSPLNFSFSTVGLLINITYNSSWAGGGADPLPHDNISNCSLYINSTTNVVIWDIARNYSCYSNIMCTIS